MASFSIVTSGDKGPPRKKHKLKLHAAAVGPVVLDFAVLGGPQPKGKPPMADIRFTFNNKPEHMLSFGAHRWTEHDVLVLDRGLLIVPATFLLLGPMPLDNELVIDADEDFFLGPVICHFSQLMP
jgi:hypothetical protein